MVVSLEYRLIHKEEFKEYRNRYNNSEKGKLQNLKRARKKRNNRRETIVKYIQKLKTDTPCMDCKQYFHYSQLDFDHIAELGDKKDRISNMVYRVSIERVMEELKKCQIVCSNCHRIRSFKRASKIFTEREIDEYLGI